MKLFTFSWGNNWIAMRGLLRVLGHELETPPPLNDATIRKGIEATAPFLCYSGKAVIGQLLDQLDMGRRNFFYLSSYGSEACRCGGTGRYLESLAQGKYAGLRWFRLGGNNGKESLEAMQSAFPGVTAKRHDRAFYIYFFKMGVIDSIERMSLQCRALVRDASAVTRLDARTLSRIDRRMTIPGLYLAAFAHGFALNCLPRKRQVPVLRIGLVGGEHILSELDFLMARIRNIADRGILLEWRSGFFAINRMADKEHPDEGKASLRFLKEKCRGYLHESPEGTEILTCARAVEFAEEGFDGILHIHAFGCLPQTAVLPALQKISRDRSIPLLSVSVGDRLDLSSLDTRIDAFIDILSAMAIKRG